MMEKYQARYPEKKFHHMVLPNNIPYKYVLVGGYLEKLQEYSIVYWDLYSYKGLYKLEDVDKGLPRNVWATIGPNL